MKKQKVIILAIFALILLGLLYFFVPEFLLVIGCVGSLLWILESLVSFFVSSFIFLFSKDQNRINRAKKDFKNSIICFLLSCLLFCFCMFFGIHLLVRYIHA